MIFLSTSIIFLWYICTVWQQQFKNEERRGIWFLFLIMEMQSSSHLLSKWWLEAIYLSEWWTVWVNNHTLQVLYNLWNYTKRLLGIILKEKGIRTLHCISYIEVKIAFCWNAVITSCCESAVMNYMHILFSKSC